jgi:3-oxoacyl-(acyl-carrier-protein) synthase
MKSIYKYELDITDSQILDLPVGSKLLSVANQNNKIVLYALVNVDVTFKKSHTIITHGTGHQANDVDDATFLGTVLLHSGQLVFHVFYK